MDLRLALSVVVGGVLWGCQEAPQALIANDLGDHVSLGRVFVGDEVEVRLARGRPIEAVRIESEPGSSMPPEELRAQAEGAALVLRFAPRAPGPFSGALVLTHAQGAPARIIVSAERLRPLRIEPRSLDFGGVQLGKTRTLGFTVTNISDEERGLAISPACAGAYCVSGSTERRLEPSSSIDVQVNFQPIRMGAAQASLRIESCAASGCALELALQGRGLTELVSCWPSALDFGAAPAGATLTRALLCENRSWAPLTLSSARVEPADQGFSVVAPASLQPGVNELSLRFRAPALAPDGTLQASLRLRAGATELAVPLSAQRVSQPPCVLSAQPGALNFGAVSGRVERTLRVENLGATRCDLGASVSGQGYSVDPAPSSIAAGGQETLTVEFSPERFGAQEGLLSLTLGPEALNVPLFGVGAFGDLTLPEVVEFGRVPEGCLARSREILIQNSGVLPVAVDSIVLGSANQDGFSLYEVPEPLPAQPLNLEPGAHAWARIWLLSERVGTHPATLELSGSSQGRPLSWSVELRGEVTAQERASATFVQSGLPKVDMLFLVSTSTTMIEEQSILPDTLVSYADWLDSGAVDFQLGLTTTDLQAGGGALIGPAINSSSLPSPAQAFRQQIAGLSVLSSTRSQGLAAVVRALTEPYASGPNAGFFRPDAYWSIVIVDDRNDSSPGTVSSYTDALALMSPAPPLNSYLGAVVGDWPDGCENSRARATQGGRYIDATSRVNGGWQSICSDWSVSRLMPSTEPFRRRRFTLPDPVDTTEPILVWVDGVPVPSMVGGEQRWEFVLDLNAVHFSQGHAPGPSAEVRIEYALWCL